MHAGSLETSGFLHLRESYPDSILVPGKTTQKKHTHTKKQHNPTIISYDLLSVSCKGVNRKKKDSETRLDTAAFLAACAKQRRMWILDAILLTIGWALPVSLVNISVLALESNITTQLNVRHFIRRFDTSSPAGPHHFGG